MRVRKPAVSGLFYPTSKDDLLQVIENCFMHSYGPQKKPPVDSDKNIIGMICPHAGYTYSGPVAAHSYYASSSLDVDLIVMIGPNHYGIGSGIATMKEGSWETPLGLISIDTNSAENVVRISGIVDYDNNAHSVDHCLEVQLPMLQYIYEKFKILPIIMWMQDKETATDVGKAIAEIIKNRNALLIASSDFTHYEPNEEARKKDNELIKAILEIDVNKYYTVLKRLQISACGYGAIASVMIAAKILGAKKGELLKYATSGDITGIKDSVVGYGSIIFT
ncbi:MAG: AmmeMemoRadiSam system protein B [Thaumarchaeota archaeon]|nr:AmmeMemoRadiSam system protein B [Nitrososphaerota archaeon]